MANKETRPVVVHMNRDDGTMPLHPILKLVSLPDETRTEIIDVVMGIVERYSEEPGVACKKIKETLDKRYNDGWNAVVGEDFAFKVAYDVNHFIYGFTNGNLGVLVWKCLSEPEPDQYSDSSDTYDSPASITSI